MAKQKSNRNILILATLAVLIMFGFSFAMVPLYSLICKATGINTSIASSELLKPITSLINQEREDIAHTITVQFIATNHNGLPWDFYPRVQSIDVHPGSNQKIFFHAKNTTERTMSVQAIPSMTPPEAITYFHKIQCFCFVQQTLKPFESKEMPMVFRIDKTIPKNIHVITLAYTLFDTTKKQG